MCRLGSALSSTATLVILIAGPLGCASGARLFTREDYSDYQADVQNIQFYVSDQTLLSRLMESYEEGVAPDHRVRTYQAYRIEEIEIDRRTPGILVGAEGDTLLVSFEPPVAGRERALRFVPDKDHFSLQVEFRRAAGQISPYCVRYDQLCFALGTIDIGIAGPSLTQGDRPSLLLETRSLGEIDKNRRRLPGRRLD